MGERKEKLNSTLIKLIISIKKKTGKIRGKEQRDIGG